jgi:hypothetical protein
MTIQEQASRQRVRDHIVNWSAVLVLLALGLV